MMRFSPAFTQGKRRAAVGDPRRFSAGTQHLYLLLVLRGGGRTHLLNAACSELSQKGLAVGYVPLDKRAYFVPEVLEGMEHLSLVCIDNIECIAGDEAQKWRFSIFITAF